MSEMGNAQEGTGPSLKERIWAAGEAVASLATRCAAALIPMAAMYGAGSLAASGLGIQSPGFMQTMGMIAAVPVVVGAPLVAAWGAARAFKEGSAGDLSWDGAKKDAGFIGGLSAAGSFAGLGLGLVASGVAAAPYVGGLLSAPFMAAGALAVVAGGGAAGLLAMDASVGAKASKQGQGGEEPSAAEQLPAESFSLSRLQRRREQKAAEPSELAPSAPKFA